MAAVLLLDSETVIDEVAELDSLTVPVAFWPPMTVLGKIVRELGV